MHVVLYQPEIPPNTGNIGRSCVGVGAKLWLVEPLGFKTDEKALRRAGMDYWQYVDCQIVPNWEALLAALPDDGSRNFWCVTKFAQKVVWDVQLQPGDVFVFGSESKGLPAAIRENYADTCIKLPMYDQIRSLNLASTANTIMYEAIRQFGGLPESI